MTTKPQWQLPTDDMPDGWYWIEGSYTPRVVFNGADGVWYVKATRRKDVPLKGRRIAPCTVRPE